MLDRVREWARSRSIGIDTREGSLIRTALAPAAVEVLQMYIELDNVLNESFADTETRDFLIRRCRERGIAVEPATFAIRRGEFNIYVPIGSRYSLNKLNYITVAELEDGADGTRAFQMRCEEAGNIGNLESGALIPIEYVEGLTSAILTDVLIPGEDEEETEHLRQRYYNSLDAWAYGGNIQDYVEKTLSLDGVGGVKVYPAWQGGGTVRLVIISNQFRIPSTTLIGAVQTAIDPIPNQGEGMGIAPIGHVVTVEGARAETVDVRLSVTFKDSWDWESVKPHAEREIDGYFDELAAGWDKVEWRDNPNSTLTVRVSQIEARILSAPGVLDVQNTLLNGEPSNLALGVDGIAVRGAVSNG
jgi:uncharacterized phage protein gp47/JayE